MGETIRDFAISYVIQETLNAERSNAIVMVTALSDNHHRLDFLLGRGKALDRYCIVVTGVLRNGLTISSSNGITRPRTSFFAFGAHRGGARDRLKA